MKNIKFTHPQKRIISREYIIMVMIFLLFGVLFLNMTAYADSATVLNDENTLESDTLRSSEILQLPSFSVLTIPSDPVCSGTATICEGSVTSISAASSGATIIYWFTGGCGVTQIGASSPGASFFVSPATTTTYYARGYNSSGFSSACCSVTVTVNPMIACAVTVNGGGTQCGGTRTLTATGGTNGTIYWQGTTINGTSTTSPSTSQIVSSSGIYYFRAYNAYGWGTQGSATVIIKSLPSIPSPVASPGIICAGSSTNLSAPVSGSTVFWYTGSCGGTQAGTGNSVNVAPAATNIYFAKAYNVSTGCWSSDCGNITVNVNPLPKSVTVNSSGTFCNSKTLYAYGGTNGTIYWQGSTSDGTSTATPSTSQTVTVSGTYYFRAHSACGWGPQESATVTIITNEPGAVAVDGGGTFCTNTTITASGGTGGTIYWQGTTSAGTSTASAITSRTVSASGTYYFRAYNGCWGTQGSVTVQINAAPNAVVVSGGGTQCSGGRMLTASGGTGGIIYWQGTTSDGTSTASATTSGTVTSTGIYYFRACSAEGCWGVQGSTTVYFGTPGAVTVSGGGTSCGNATLAAGGGTGGIIYWQNTVSNGTSTATAATSRVLGTSGTYYYRANNTCGWGTQGSASVTINTNPGNVAVSGGGTICSSTVTLTASGGTNGTIYWQGTTSGGTSTATATTSRTVTSAGTYYFRARSSAGCWSNQQSATVYLNTPAAVTVSGGGTDCDHAILTASGGTGGSIYWQGTTSGGTSTVTPSTNQTVSSSGTYYFRAYNNCGWGAQGSATVTIKTLPGNVIVSGGGNLASGATITLTAAGGTNGTIYWQNITSNGTSTATASTVQTVSVPGNYYFRAYDQQCWGNQGSATVSVDPLLNMNITTNNGEDIYLTCNQVCTALEATSITVSEQTDSYFVSSVPYAPPYPYDTGTPILVNIDDRWSSVINLPFTFCFFGNSYNQLIAGSNGVISFNYFDANGYCPYSFTENCPSPNLILNAIYGVYHDIDPTSSGTMYYAILGTFPCRTFVVNWDHIPMFLCDSVYATHQIVLYETSNIIDVYIHNKPTVLDWNNGNAIVGIQNATGSQGLAAPGRNTSPVWSAQDEAWRFTPAGSSTAEINWYSGSQCIGTGNSIPVCPSTNTTYLAEVSYNTCNGQTVTLNDDITVFMAADSVGLSPASPVICEGDSVGITASGYGTYLWSPATGLNHATGAVVHASPAATTIYTVTGSGQGCTSTNTVTVTVNPRPAIVNNTTVICSGASFTSTPINGTNGVVPAGTTYSWPAPVVPGITGAAAGTNANNISGTLTNTTNAPINVVYTVTPVTGTCQGAPYALTVTVIPTPFITNMTTTVCSGNTFTFSPVNGTNGLVPAGTNYSWSAPSVAGITGTASGSNASVISGTLTNTTNAAINVTYYITPRSGVCQGNTFNVTVTVNPTPAISNMTTTVCSGNTFTFSPVNGTNGVVPAGTTYSWPAPAVAGIYGTSAGINSSSVSGTLTNATNVPINVVYTVTPARVTCVGGVFSATVIVKPRPTLISQPDISVCNNNAVAATNFNSVPSGGTYTWTNSNTAIGLAASGTGNISSFIAINTGSDPVIATINITPFVNGCSGDPSSYSITVNTFPYVHAGYDTLCTGLPVSVQLGDLLNGPGTFAWSPSTGLNDTTLAQPLASPTVTTTYTLSVNNNGCIATDDVTIYINTGHSIYGKTKYKGRAFNGSPAPNLPTYNPAIYNIDRVIVMLRNYPSGTELARDTSDASGNYLFTDVPDGDYLLSYDKFTADTMQWGNDVNVADVAMLKYFIASDSLLDPSRCFSSKYMKAANVDNNLYINVADVARIKSKIASPYSAGKNFPKGNWLALDKAVTVSGSDVNINLETICYGDYNASSSKYRDSATTWNGLKSLPSGIIVVSDEYITIADPDYFEIPLRISTKMNELSALGLELTYPSDAYKLANVIIPKAVHKTGSLKINPTLEEIIKADNDLLVTDESWTIRVVYATTEHFNVSPGEDLIILGFRSLHPLASGPLEFNLEGSGLIADQYGIENENAYLLMPRLFVRGGVSETGFEFTAHPNPFGGEATINYVIPENGSVKIMVYNALGELVSELVNSEQAGGRHTVLFSADDLPSGVYTFKLEYFGSDKAKCLILKLIH